MKSQTNIMPSNDSTIFIKTIAGNDSGIKWKKESWYNAGFQTLCDETEGRFLDINKFKKYGKHNPYDTIQRIFKDSAIISFNFISDCCLEYSGEAVIRKGILYLGYGLEASQGPCDCYCDYRMTYKIESKNRNWKKIIIMRGRLN